MLTINKERLLKKMDQLQEKYDKLRDEAEVNKDKYNMATAAGIIYGILAVKKLIINEKTYYVRDTDG